MALSFTLLIFLIIVFLLNFKKRELHTSLSMLNDLYNEKIKIENKIFLYNMVKTDLNFAEIDLNKTLYKARSAQNLLQNLHNNEENLSSKYSNKSVALINGEINRLLPNLRMRASQGGIRLEAQKEMSLDYEFSNVNNDENFGFGLSAYDGFWPNFDIVEANLLGFQSVVIKELVDYILDSSKEKSISLISIKREPVGFVDKKHIGDDLIDFNEQDLLRNTGFVKSFVFGLKFKGNTNNARSFINQLRPPFHLSFFKTFRLGNHKIINKENEIQPVEESNSKIDILPIVDNVESIFELHIEYIHGLNYDLATNLSSIKDSLNKNYSTQFTDQVFNSLFLGDL